MLIVRDGLVAVKTPLAVALTAIILLLALLVGAYIVGGRNLASDLGPLAFWKGETPTPNRPKLPRMQLQAQFAGPFEDTIIQRWRDPIDGRICYLFIPVAVKRQVSEQTGLIDYGGNAIGSISCGAPGSEPLPAPAGEPAKAPEPEK